MTSEERIVEGLNRLAEDLEAMVDELAARQAAEREGAERPKLRVVPRGLQDPGGAVTAPAPNLRDGRGHKTWPLRLERSNA
jgi:hypothetical protein